VARVSARAGHRVALTFDAEHPDRPATPGGHDRLLDALDDLDVRATFFLQGRWVEAFPATAHRIAAGGHLVGNHSHYHARLPLLSHDGLRADLADAESVIRREARVDPRPWFRAPFGAGPERQGLLDVLAELGYRHVGWHVGPEDWRPGRGVEEIAAAIVDGVTEHGDGAIVLLHTWPDRVAEAVATAIDRLAAAGATFVGVDQLDLARGLASVGEPRPGALAPPVGAG
jgi:peptidoglycan-N-acetylglucosamine deacetylase